LNYLRLQSILGAVLVTLMLGGCASTVRARSVHQSFSSSAPREAAVDAIQGVLTRNGFSVASANERLGVVSTTYRRLEDSSGFALNALSRMNMPGRTPDRTYISYSGAIMIRVQVDEGGFRVAPKIKRSSTAHTTFRDDTEDSISYPAQDSAEGKLVAKIVSEINQSLGIPDAFFWEDREVKAEAEEPDR